MNFQYPACVQAAPLQHTHLTESIRRGLITVEACAPDCIFAASEAGEDGGRTCYISAANEAAAKRLLAGVHRNDTVVAHHAYETRLAVAAGCTNGTTECVCAVYETKNAPLAFAGEAEMRTLDVTYADALRAHYHLFDDPAYFTRLLLQGVMLGAFINDQLAGFIGEHEDGAMGLLEVFPAFRRRGLGEALEAEKIRRTLARGDTPFCDIVYDNAPSLQLQKKLGLSISKETITWVF